MVCCISYRTPARKSNIKREQTHKQTSTKTSVRSPDTQLLRNLDQPGGSTFTRKPLGLVDLRQHGVCRLGNNRRRETSNQTRAKVDTGLRSIAERRLVDPAVDGLRNLLVDDELRHRVRNLFEQDGPEPGVESTDTLILQDLGKPREKTTGKVGLGNETDTGSLERAESDIGEELSKRRRGKIDSSSVVASGIITLCASGLASFQYRPISPRNEENRKNSRES